QNHGRSDRQAETTSRRNYRWRALDRGQSDFVRLSRRFVLSFFFVDLSQVLAHNRFLSERPRGADETFRATRVSALKVNPTQCVPEQRKLIGHPGARIRSTTVVKGLLLEYLQCFLPVLPGQIQTYLVFR